MIINTKTKIPNKFTIRLDSERKYTKKLSRIKTINIKTLVESLSFCDVNIATIPNARKKKKQTTARNILEVSDEEVSDEEVSDEEVSDEEVLTNKQVLQE